MIRLFVNVYTDPSSARNAELIECLDRNKHNPFINEIVTMEGRPTITEFIARIRKVSSPDDVSLIANSDIAFDETAELFNRVGPKECWALTRWEDGHIMQSIGPGGRRIGYPDSQDVWAFRGVPNIRLDYTLGTFGVDNRMARLFADAGYAVTNPSLSVKCHHLHASGVVNYKRGVTPTVPPPYLTVHATELPA